MSRVRLTFAGKEVPFIDRDAAIRQVEELADKDTALPVVIYGPEGCGKTAFFRQAMEVLKDHGYSVVHVNPMARVVEDKLLMTDELRGLMKDVLNIMPNPFKDALSLIDLAVEILYTAIRRNVKRRIALLADDVFQAVGLDKAEQLVKSFLNMIEWPSVRYEKIVVLVASSEGVTRRRVGRHRWADMYVMWNMDKRGFSQLYEQLEDREHSIDEAWRLTGGNPKMLDMVYQNSWNADKIVDKMISERDLRNLVAGLGNVEREILQLAIEDPDVIFNRMREAEGLLNKLIESNMLIGVFDRKPYLWIDEPPPERDPELGIGRYFAWQTPIHREAVRRVLEESGPKR